MTDHKKVTNAANLDGTSTQKAAAAHPSDTTPDHQSTPAAKGHVAPENARAFPPSDTVDVPNLPKTLKTTEATGGDSQPSDSASADAVQSNPGVDTTKHSWADNTQPAPDKKNARSSIL